MTGAKIPLAGVIGHPIAHSKSPRLHGHWLRHYAIAGHYVPMDIAPEHLAKALRAMPDMGFVGANVTIPHKEAALALADEVSAAARRIGAANTLTFQEDGTCHADNTDAYGFMQNLTQNAPQWRPSAGPAVVLGAGGAARAVLVALLDAGAPVIFLANRSQDRADALAQEFGPRITTLAWGAVEGHFASATTIVNTTALGMAGQADLPFDLSRLSSGTLVSDIVYNPLETALLRKARQSGCHVVDGLGMLLHQAAPGFARWFGQMPQVDEATRFAVLG